MKQARVTKRRNFSAYAADRPPEPGLAALCAWVYLGLILLMPWFLATQTPPALLRRWALVFEPVLGLGQLVAIGTPHAFEECVDLGVVGISAIAGALLLGVRYFKRVRMGTRRINRTYRFGERLAPAFLALICVFFWIAALMLHDYSGVKSGAITRLIDTNLVARGIFCAALLIGSTYSLLGVAFFTFAPLSAKGQPPSRG